MENNVHIRYCCYSKPLWDKLKELGFEERGSDPSSQGTKQIKRFYKNNLNIEDSYNGLHLYAINDEMGPKSKSGNIGPVKQLKYHGKSVNKELLENFAKRGIYYE